MRHRLGVAVAVGLTCLMVSGSALFVSSGRAQQDSYVSSPDGTLPEGARDIDAYWQRTFQGSGFAYRPPSGVRQYQGSTLTGGCGPASDDNAAFYCPADEAIYLSSTGLKRWGLVAGDFSYVAILAHEWGHHVQHLVGIDRTGRADEAFELQADCLAGAYAQDAKTRGMLDPGDVTEAVETAINAADPIDTPSTDPHGINDDRVTAFMKGFLDGLRPCSLPFNAAGGQVVQQAQPANPAPPVATGRTAASYLPGGPAVADGSCFTVSAQGAYPAADVDAFLAGAGAGPGATRTLQWLDGAYIDFRCPSPPPGMASFLGVVIHRFGSPTAASQAAGYWQAGHAPQANEVYRCVSQGALVVCADGIAAAGPPVDEVNTLLQQVLAAAG